MKAYYVTNCRMCGETHEIEVDMKGLLDWKQGKLIQEALPELSVDDRELMISDTCGSCFRELFGES